MSDSAKVPEKNHEQHTDEALHYRRRFDALVQAHSAFVWTTDRDGNFVEEQPGWSAYTGQSYEEYTVRGGFSAIHPDDRERVGKRWTVSTRESARYEIDMRIWHHATQSWHWCTLRAVPVLDDDGRVTEWVGTAIDIDEGKRRRIELGENERRFRSIMERVQAVGIMLDGKGRVIFANDFLLSLTGWKREEVIGQDYFERFIEGGSLRDQFSEAIRNGDIFAHAENEILTRTRERKMISWDNTVLRDNDGKVIGTASIGRDITQRLRAERELRESGERLRLVLSASHTGIWEFDLGVNALTWSDECFTIFAIKREEFDGRPETFWNLIHPEDRDRIRNGFDEFIRNRSTYSTEYRIVRPDGEVRWVANLGHAVLDNEERPLRVAGTLIDITDRKQTEEALRKAERFAAAGRMAATVAHEINNPLASLVNVMYLLGTQALPAAAHELVNIGNAELNRVVRIAKQTLGFYQVAKPSSNIDIRTIVEDVVASFEAVAHKRDIELSARFRGTLPLLHGFGDEIRQVLINALTNAIESGATQVEIRVRQAQQWKSERRSGVKISVIDNGKGVAPEHLRRLFEPFFTTKGEKGTGLGLWVSRGIVLKHEGNIMLRSSTRKGRSGTCLSIFLPAGPAKSVALAAEGAA